MSDKDTLKDAKEAFAIFSDQESDQRARMLEDWQFRSGEQWPDDLKRHRENDPKGARPCLVMDRTNQHIRRVVNDARMNRPGIKVRPVDNHADIETATMLQGLTRNIEDVSKADISYDWAVECSATAGLGWFRIVPKVVDERGNQEPRILRLANPLSVYTGNAWTEPDGCDIERALVTERMGRKAFIRQYPDADPCGLDGARGDELEWIGSDDLQIAECFWISETSTNMLSLRGLEGEMSEDDYWTVYEGVEGRPEVAGNRAAKSRTVHWIKMTAREILEKTIVPSYYVPLIPVIGRELWVGNKRILHGMVRPAMDAQRLYNYNRSVFAEMVSLSPKAKWLMAEGQDEGYEDMWAKAHVSTDPRLIYRTVDVEGKPAPPPQRVYGPEVPPGLVQDLQLSERDLEAAMGQYAPSLGAPSRERSGVALRAQQVEGEIGSFDLTDNLARSVRQCGRILLGSDEGVGMVQQLYDTKRIARVLGEDGSTEYAEIDPEAQRAFAKYRQMNGKVRRIYNPNLGRYDVTVQAGPSFNTRRQEANAAMVEILRAAPQVVQTHGDLIFKSQDWPMADEFAERFKMMLPPQIQQQMQQKENEGEAQIPPQVQAALQQMQQIIQAQQQALGQAQQALQQAEMKAQAAQNSAQANVLKAENDKLRVQIEASKTAISAFEAETDRFKATADAQPKVAEAQSVALETEATLAALNQAAGAMAAIMDQVTQGNVVIAQTMAGIQAQLAKMAEEKPEKAERKVVEMVTPSGAVYRGVVTES